MRLPRSGWLVLGVATIVASPLRALANDDLVMRAMRDELTRSVAQLRLEDLERPYFISYRVEERRDQRISATFGGVLNRYEGVRRFLNVEVRVGSPALDNTNFLSGDFSGGGMPTELPLDGDYTELRRQIWLATDRAYKQALESLSRKKAALENKTRADETPDFSPEEPRSLTDLRPGKPIDIGRAEALVRELSAVFREAPAVATSQVSLNAADELTRYVNSEGTSFTREEALLDIDATARAQAPDGFWLGDHLIAFHHSWEDLPPKAELLSSVRELGAQLAMLRDAPLMDTYSGPVLFEGQAAAEVFSQVFAPRLTAKKRPVAERAEMEGMAAARENPFVDKLGARVLPDFLDVTDDPTSTRLGSAPLFGDARVDDEGVPARTVRLVEGGRLKTLLVSRSPVRGIPRSTGSREGQGPTPRNLIVSASGGLDAAALEAELIKLVQQRGREYGVVVRRLGNPIVGSVHAAGGPAGGDGVPVEPVILAYRLYPDGREELVRCVEIAGMNAAAFKDVVAAGREPFVNTVPYRSPESPSPQVVSFAVPSLLFDDVTLRKPGGEVPKPPVAKHPFFDR
jgi:hypothetical protein